MAICSNFALKFPEHAGLGLIYLVRADCAEIPRQCLLKSGLFTENLKISQKLGGISAGVKALELLGGPLHCFYYKAGGENLWQYFWLG